ncbi:MAG: class I SAM-dependent methyltransferase [Thiotrichaceae bacterium]
MSSHFKDHFSSKSADYSQYRPDYPVALFEYLAKITPGHQRVWDCATGSGQAAIALSSHFRKVFATDASKQQIINAQKQPNIHYAVAPAEQSGLDDNSVDLIVVAQALHWFDLNAFTVEVKRVLKADGLLAVWTYNLLEINPHIDQCVNRLYAEVLNGYWPRERALIESGYREINFPFAEIKTPSFKMEMKWSLEQLTGYLRTWSAVKNYLKEHDNDPVDVVEEELVEIWQGESMQVEWPLTLRVWRLSKTS